ncbi:MAG: SDR family oxidoreductase [Terrimicrobiaceae bacterium]|nr:SDR family oxidoreductase [Terrimicrobiaceae bacterium]
MFSLVGKIAIVTGAASGIGLAVAERFLAAGADVTGLDRSPKFGRSFPCIQGDVADESQLAAAFDGVAAQHGRLDIVVNNAGIQPLGVGFADLTPQLLERTFAINTHGVALGIKHAARHLGHGGRIVNTGSFVGTIGVPGGSAYAASKAAVIHLTRLAAVELAPRGITVNCVCPGTVATPAVLGIPNNPEIPFAESRTPLGRLATPGEVAAAFHFLASDEAGYITGAILPVDGGITAGWERYDLTPPDESIWKA